MTRPGQSPGYDRGNSELDETKQAISKYGKIGCGVVGGVLGLSALFSS